MSLFVFLFFIFSFLLSVYCLYFVFIFTNKSSVSIEQVAIFIFDLIVSILDKLSIYFAITLALTALIYTIDINQLPYELKNPLLYSIFVLLCIVFVRYIEIAIEFSSDFYKKLKIKESSNFDKFIFNISLPLFFLTICSFILLPFVNLILFKINNGYYILFIPIAIGIVTLKRSLLGKKNDKKN